VNRLSEKILPIFGCVSALALFYASCVEPFLIELTEKEILCPRLPKSFDGFTVLQISDIHMSKLGLRERLMLRLLKDLSPSIIAYTGDLIHTESGMAPFFKMAKSFNPSCGSYAVYGNSEHKNGVDQNRFAKSLADNSIIPLLNSHIALSNGTDTIEICGTDDPVTSNDNLSETFEGVPENRFKLLLMHSPDNIAEAVFRGADFVLSGHTHGGQVRFPIIGAKYTHSLLGSRMNSGLYSEKRLRSIIGRSPGASQLYVSRGVGSSGLTLRFLCRPEVTLFTLRSL
jgi:predicted MPP superfamily phosphohydrolase